MLRCAITDGKTCSFVNTAQMERLQNQVRRWAVDGIDLIQIREKQLEPGDLLRLTEAALQALLQTNSSTKLVVNGRADVAIAARAHGVHLTAHRDELDAPQVHALFAHAGLPAPVVTVSCHTHEEIARARDQNADYVLFGPVFEKRVEGERVVAGVGLERLHDACAMAKPVRVLALGGITRDDVASCTAAGAVGIAGIRTFL